ncbi:MAG: hypothetical protein O3A84_04525 [Proteobacteria bacterium]|nr:hypothetical protein [Pseudomonadota bacterium]
MRKSIMTWAPNHVVYLSEPSGTLGLIREYLFFRCCGIRQFTGFPFNTQKRRFTQIGEDEWESEAGRLLRTVGGNSEDARIWRITFTDEERQLAAGQLTSWSSGTKDQQRFVAFSIGGKGADKDWGDPNWQSVLKEVSQANPNLGLIGIGAGNETERTDALLDHWSGPTLNLCGRTAPRISAQVMAPAEFYLGHDSGPMHLAALVGTRCLAVFSARAKPGVWFPQGEHNRIFYPWHESAAAPQEAGANRIAATIHTIKPESVIEACKEMLAENPVAG